MMPSPLAPITNHITCHFRLRQAGMNFKRLNVSPPTIKWNEAGQIVEFKLMRPLPAVRLIHQIASMLLVAQ